MKCGNVGFSLQNSCGGFVGRWIVAIAAVLLGSVHAVFLSRSLVHDEPS